MIMFIVFDFSYPGLVSSLGRFSPLKNQILKPAKVKVPTYTNFTKVNRPLKYRSRNKLSMKEAIGAVNIKGMSRLIGPSSIVVGIN